MRHGEPDYKNDAHALTPRGILQAQSVAQQVIDHGVKPQLIISSDLARARQTADVLAEQLKRTGHEAAMRVDPRLQEIESYPKDSPVAGIRAALSDLGDPYDTAAMVAHRDEIAQAVYLLTGQSISFHYADAGLVECPEESWTAAAASRLNVFQRLFEPDVNA